MTATGLTVQDQLLDPHCRPVALLACMLTLVELLSQAELLRREDGVGWLEGRKKRSIIVICCSAKRVDC